MKLAYDPNITVSYGYYRCPACRAEFYGGGKAMHEKSCAQTGYEACILVIGDKQVEEVLEKASKHGDDYQWWGVSLNDLREQLPTLLTTQEET